jgi:hypothetical protein
VELNFVFVLNYLAIDKDWNVEIQKEQKKQEQLARQRARIK